MARGVSGFKIRLEQGSGEQKPIISARVSRIKSTYIHINKC
jgi:hypothetical protein